MTRRLFLNVLPLLAVGRASGGGAGSADPRVRFGVIADCQYADAPVNTQLNRHYRLSPEKLRQVVAQLNRSALDFVVNLGDTIDRGFDSFDVVLPIFRELRAPCHHALGNHDYDVADDLKAQVARKLGIQNTNFFSWNVRGWRFLVLDGNEVSLFAHPKGSPAHEAARRLRESLPGPPADYNGALGDSQLRWLEDQLAAARLHRERVIVFCHYPVFPKNPHNLWNADAIVQKLAPFSDVVAAWMNGHNHAGHYGRAQSIHCVTFKGMVDTTENCWAEVAVFDDRLEVSGFAREPDRSLKIGAAN